MMIIIANVFVNTVFFMKTKNVKFALKSVNYAKIHNFVFHVKMIEFYLKDSANVSKDFMKIIKNIPGVLKF